MVIMVAVIILIKGLSTHKWMDSLMFASSIAAGLIPESKWAISSSYDLGSAVNWSGE